MARIAEFDTTIHATSDKKKLKAGDKEYHYGTINIRDPKLNEHVGKRVRVTVEDLERGE